MTTRNDNSFTIGYKDVESDIIMLSEYIAAKVDPTAEAYDKLRAITYDEPLLKSWFRASLNVIGFMLDRALKTDIDSVPDAVTITLKHDNHRTAIVADNVKDVIKYYVVCQWLKLVLPTMLQYYENELQERKMLLLQNALYREMPK